MAFQHKIKLSLIALLLVTSPLAAAPAAAQIIDEDSATADLNAAREQRAIYEHQQNDLAEQAELSTDNLAATEAQLAKQRAEVAVIKVQLEGINQKVQSLKRQRGIIMHESYISSTDDSLFYALVNSGSLSEFLSRGQYTLFLLSRKDKLIDAVDGALDRYDRQRQDLVTKLNALEVAERDLQTKLAQIRAAQAENSANLDAARRLEAYLASLTGNSNHNDRDFLRNNQPVNGRFMFGGGGTEHGLGLSQYGAKGFAEHGMNYRQIIAHYYQHTQIQQVNDNPRVNVGGDMETYLVGVVEAEMNSNWPMETLKAQAVAARSYAYINRDRLDNSPRTQAWVGPSRQTARARQAVAETRGQVVTYNGDVLPAYYHSTSGGWTENNENVWGGSPLAWLRGVSSPYETDSPHWFWQSSSYSRQQMQDILNQDGRTNVGQLHTIKIVGRGVSGRVTAVQIVGSGGVKVVSGPRFKSIFNAYSPAGDPPLRSTMFGFI